MSVTVVIGTQWGDEGKAKYIDFLSPRFDIVARYAGGANAGHTVIHNGEKFIFHLIPSGILHEEMTVVIGNGVVLDFESLLNEINTLQSRGLDIINRLKISDAMHIILPYHQDIDKAAETLLGKEKIGTTGRGIGPAYQDKVARRGLRLGDLQDKQHLATRLKAILEYKNKELSKLYSLPAVDFQDLYERLRSFYDTISKTIVNCSQFLNDNLQNGKKVLLEGAQATGLDIDHGTYPFVTSSNPTIGGALSGVGIGPKWIDKIIGIAKAYTTRVGSGPFPSEMDNDTAAIFRETGGEYGATTGRPRRCGWLDLMELKMAVEVNGISQIALTKLDVLDKIVDIQVTTKYRKNGQVISRFPSNFLDSLIADNESYAGWQKDTSQIRSYDQLPEQAINYLEAIEKYIGIPIAYISVGADRNATIDRKL